MRKEFSDTQNNDYKAFGFYLITEFTNPAKPIKEQIINQGKDIKKISSCSFIIFSYTFVFKYIGISLKNTKKF